MTLLEFLIWCEKIGVRDIWSHDGGVIYFEPDLLSARSKKLLLARIRRFKLKLVKMLRKPPHGARYALGI